MVIYKCNKCKTEENVIRRVVKVDLRKFKILEEGGEWVDLCKECLSALLKTLGLQHLEK